MKKLDITTLLLGYVIRHTYCKSQYDGMKHFMQKAHQDTTVTCMVGEDKELPLFIENYVFKTPYGKEIIDMEEQFLKGNTIYWSATGYEGNEFNISVYKDQFKNWEEAKKYVQKKYNNKKDGKGKYTSVYNVRIQFSDFEFNVNNRDINHDVYTTVNNKVKKMNKLTLDNTKDKEVLIYCGEDVDKEGVVKNFIKSLK